MCGVWYSFLIVKLFCFPRGPKLNRGISSATTIPATDEELKASMVAGLCILFFVFNAKFLNCCSCEMNLNENESRIDA